MPRPVTILMFFGLAVATLAFPAACASESEDSTTEPAPTAMAEAAPKPEPTPTAVPTPSLSLPITEDTLTAPRIMGEGVNEWINSEELILADLQAENKVVLIDFWTYTCINCIRTLPYLKQWHDKYADSGLVIIGVHTPEFEFEKSLENVQEAVEPVRDRVPRRAGQQLLDLERLHQPVLAREVPYRQGRIHPATPTSGRAGTTRPEQAIRLLLEEADQGVADISDAENPIRLIAPNAVSSRSPDGLTRELYAGTDRNYSALRSGIRAPYVLNEEFYKQGSTDTEYIDPGDWQNHHIYLQGLWHNGEESLRHARMTEGFEDYMALRFNAVDVNVVLRTQSETPYTVQIRMDGEPADKRGRRHRHLVRRRGKELHHRR